MKGDNDSWCTQESDVLEILGYVGLTCVDLDTASNVSSVVPCRFAYTFTDDRTEERFPAWWRHEILTTEVTPGGKKIIANSLEHRWPACCTVWCNPPYSNPASFVASALVHMLEGGAGAMLVPNYGLDTAWGQALLAVLSWVQGVGIDVAILCGESGALRLLAMSKFCAPYVGTRLLEWCDSQKLWARWSDLACALWMMKGRLAFVDPETLQVVANNRGGSMVFYWGVKVTRPNDGVLLQSVTGRGLHNGLLAR